MSTLRVCIVAEHASKNFGGEAILPFHYFRILRRRRIDAFLIVHERTRTELTALFPDDLERLRFVADRPLQKLFFRVSKLLPRRIAESTFGLANQLLTQHAQRAILRKLIHSHTIIHQPIPVSPRFPSLLSGLGAPLIIGSLNGGMEYPPAFRHAESAASRFAIALGRSLSNAVNAMLPGKRSAAIILVANQRTRAALPSGLRGRIVELAENAVDLAQWQLPSTLPPPTEAAMFLFIGRLVDWKALEIVLEALAATPAATLEVIGGGPMLGTWRAQAEVLGIANRVTFHGWLPQPDCVPHLARARALVLPSIYESGGAVVLEAMAMSRAVIATAWGGPADYLDEACGILVPPTSRAALVSGFAQAMQRLGENPAAATAMGNAGRAKVESTFDWETKVDAVLELYASVLPSDTIRR